MAPLLEVNDLSIGFGAGPPVVDRVSFALNAGETLALVGESGSGKTLSCRSVLRLLPDAAQMRGGSIRFNGAEGPVDLLALPEKQMRAIRGDRISMIFQEPMRSLSPLHRIGDQVAEVLRLHRDMGRGAAKRAVLQQFEKVGFADPMRAWKSYPFEMSGGMRQRAMIAMAMVAKPELLIADEPTTALDVTTQAQVLGLIRSLQAETGMGVILVTHDLGVVANMAQKVVVMHKGRVMERGDAQDVLGSPAHPYTAKLFAAAPMIPAVAVHDLSPAERKAFQRQAQMVFQDPYSSLSPRMRVQQALTEPMEVHNIGTARDRREKAAEMLRWVGLNPDMLGRFPHAFSGGQRQRLSIARALTLDPKLLICDEPTSALDVSVQEQILTLLEDIRDRANLSYLFISHDLAVVARIADEVAVMRAGVIVEQAPPDTLFYNPQHPYTRALIAAQPEPDISRPIDLDLVAKGAGSPTLWPEQFRFEGHHAPALRELEPGHKVRCHA